MRMLALCAGVLVLFAGCASTGDPPAGPRYGYFFGEGGIKVIEGGLDIWVHGTPPRPFKVVGFVVRDVGAVPGSEDPARVSVAGEVRKLGGQAAIEVNGNAPFIAMLQHEALRVADPGPRKLKFAAIQ